MRQRPVELGGPPRLPTALCALDPDARISRCTRQRGAFSQASQEGLPGAPVGGRHAQDPADGLDPEVILALLDECAHFDQSGPSSLAKNTLADFKISFSRRSFEVLVAELSLGSPDGDWPANWCARYWRRCCARGNLWGAEAGFGSTYLRTTNRRCSVLDRRDESNLFDRGGVSQDAAPADATSNEGQRGATIAR